MTDMSSALQSLNLPGSIQALERPAGLPPSLLKKAEEVESEGGVQRIESLLNEVQRLSRSNSKILYDVSHHPIHVQPEEGGANDR